VLRSQRATIELSSATLATTFAAAAIAAAAIATAAIAAAIAFGATVTAVPVASIFARAPSTIAASASGVVIIVLGARRLCAPRWRLLPHGDRLDVRLLRSVALYTAIQASNAAAFLASDEAAV